MAPGEQHGAALRYARAVTSLIAVPDAVRGHVGLGPRLRADALALAEALFATREGPPPGEHLAWLGDELDDFLRHAGAHARRSFGLCLFAVSRLAPLFVGRLGGFARLPLDLRTRGLERMEASPLGLPFFGAKAILCVVWYEHPENAKRAGYDGGCLVGLRRSRDEVRP